MTLKATGETSSDASEQRVVRKRYGGPRSKSGCITCRIRHVKCDEAKPLCNRCIKTGRKCDGYPKHAWEVVDVSSMETMLTMSTDPRAANNPHAGKSFKFFETMTTGYFGGLFDQSLWQEVLRASQHNDAMWHAATALGSAYQAFMHRKFDMQTSEEDWALQQYNRAIRSLTKADALGEQPPLEVIMTASILFMAFEMLRREYGKAINHIRSGISIYGEHSTRTARQQERGSKSPSPPSGASPINVEQLEHVLRQLETHLCEINMERTAGPSMPRRSYVGRKMLPQSTIDSVLTTEPLPSPPPSLELEAFSSIREARIELDGYWHNMMFIMHELIEPEVFVPDYTPDVLFQRCVEFQSAFATWRLRFDMLRANLAAQPQPPSARDTRNLAQLEMYHLAGAQILETYVDGREAGDDTIWDEFQGNFEHMLDLCDIVVSATDAADGADGSPTMGGFQLDQGIVASCFHTMWKCRAAAVRRRAIALLEARQRQEGLWDAQLVAKVGWLMDSMERGPGLLDEAAARNAPPQEIPVWKRVMYVAVQFSSEGRHAVIQFVTPKSEFDPTEVTTMHVLSW